MSATHFTLTDITIDRAFLYYSYNILFTIFNFSLIIYVQENVSKQDAPFPVYGYVPTMVRRGMHI